jgi:hypothetical protein
MSAKNPVGDNEKATPVVADDWQETLKRIGGSQSDDWNHVLGDQALQSLWIKQSDKEVRQRQYNAAIAGLIGIGPKDEIESMIGAQLIATHNAAMECYRRAMMGEQTFEGARTRSGSRCRSAAMPNGRCRMHGGMSPGAPKGNKNAFKHGHYTAEAIATRREIANLLRDARALVKEVS